MNYKITLVSEKENEIDIDELECINDQILAIANGWGHHWGKVFIKEEVTNMYEWEKI